jgi:rSAM/selenodomain-associated transferase 2
MNPDVSIIIPTLNEANSISEVLERVESFGKIAEVIVVDGGSIDETVSIAGGYNAKVLHAPRGRGTQMHVGAKAASGDVLWFLHADTIPPFDAIEEIITALKDTKTIGGNFTIRFDGESGAARFLTWLYPNLRKIGLIYGDSAIFVRRTVYERVGGFKPFPIFEDLDLVRRLKSVGQMANLSAKVTTSSRRFENRSFLLTFMRWSFLQVLFWLGVSPFTLVKMYPAYRKKDKN